jgi:hypothetical protein
MKTLRIKVTSMESPSNPHVALFSHPDIKHDTDKTLEHIRAEAVAIHKARQADVYELIDDLTYYAVRGARLWILTEPGDWDGDHLFRLAMVRAGIVKDTSQVHRMETTGADDFTVKVTTDIEQFTINTKDAIVTIHTPARAEGLKGPITRNE